MIDDRYSCAVVEFKRIENPGDITNNSSYTRRIKRARVSVDSIESIGRIIFHWHPSQKCKRAVDGTSTDKVYYYTCQETYLFFFSILCELDKNAQSQILNTLYQESPSPVMMLEGDSSDDEYTVGELRLTTDGKKLFMFGEQRVFMESEIVDKEEGKIAAVITKNGYSVRKGEQFVTMSKKIRPTQITIEGSRLVYRFNPDDLQYLHEKYTQQSVLS